MIKPNYIIIPLITIFVSVLGSWITSNGMKWYDTIKLPAWTPQGSVIGTAWTIIFILATISALLAWNSYPRNDTFLMIIGLFILNAFFNVFWSYLFFGVHMINAALIEIFLLEATVILLIILMWPLSKLASALLLPYAGWVAFATYLLYIIWGLNK